MISEHGDLGIDVEELVAEGVDMLNLSNYFFTAQQSDIQQLRKIAPNTGIYLEMTHVAARVIFNNRRVQYSASAYPRMSDEQFYSTAYLARRRGADGVSLFNFVTNSTGNHQIFALNWRCPSEKIGRTFCASSLEPGLSLITFCEDVSI